MNAMTGSVLAVGLLAVPWSAGAQPLATPIDGGINAGVTTSLHSAETADVRSQGFVGAPVPLSQRAHALSGSPATEFVEGSASIDATWASPDEGTVTFQLEGAIQAACCGNSVYTSPTFLDDWHYTFVPTTDGVFRLGYSLTGTGFGTCGFRVFVNGTQVAGLDTPDDGTTLSSSRDFPLTAGQPYTFALDGCAGFSTTGSALTGFVVTASFSFQVLVPGPADQLAELLDEVAGLDLKAGLGGALSSKLENALAAIERGDLDAARALLESFINAVEAQRGKALTTAQADALVAQAQAILASLSGV